MGAPRLASFKRGRLVTYTGGKLRGPASYPVGRINLARPATRPVRPTERACLATAECRASGGHSHGKVTLYSVICCRRSAHLVSSRFSEGQWHRGYAGARIHDKPTGTFAHS